MSECSISSISLVTLAISCYLCYSCNSHLRYCSYVCRPRPSSTSTCGHPCPSVGRHGSWALHFVHCLYTDSHPQIVQLLFRSRGTSCRAVRRHLDHIFQVAGCSTYCVDTPALNRLVCDCCWILQQSPIVLGAGQDCPQWLPHRSALSFFPACYHEQTLNLD